METHAGIDRSGVFINEAILNPANSRKLLIGNEKQETLQRLGQEIKDFNAVQTETLLKIILSGLSTDDRYWTQGARESALSVLPIIDLQKIVPKNKIFDHYSSAVGNILDLGINQLDPYGEFDAVIRAGSILAPHIASSAYGKAEIDSLINELKTKAKLYPMVDATYLLDQIDGLEERIYNYEIEQEKDEGQGREELANQVKALQDAGLSFTEIADQLGESIQAVVSARQTESDQSDLSLVQIPGSNLPNINAGDTPDSIITSIHETKAESKDGYLTPEQQKALNLLQEKVKTSVMQYLDQKQTGDLSPLVAMATGIGKGRIIHLLIEEQMRKNPGSKVLLIVGTKNILVKQSNTKLSEYQQLGKLTEDIDEYVEAESEDELVQETTDIEENPLEGQTSSEYTTGRIGDINTNVHLATIQTTHSRMITNRLNPDDYDLVIVDEVHNVGTPKRKDTIDKFRRVAGFTATPYRNSGDLKDPEEYGFKIIESFSLPDAQNAGFIPPLLGVQINTKNLVSEIPTNSAGEINYRKLERLLKDSPDLLPYISDRIERLLISPEGRTYKTIIAVNFVWEAEKMSQLLNKAGFRVGVAVNQEAAKSIHTEDIPAKDSVERYHLPEDDPRSIEILISPYVASEGFDAPFTEVVVWASPTQSGLRYTQFTGRVTRRFPGKPFGLIIDCLYQTNQHTWSYNMARWFKENVKSRNGLLYLGPANQMESITNTVPAQTAEQQLTQEDKIPLTSLQEEGNLERSSETDAAITTPWLTGMFIGSHEMVRALAEQVVDELKEKDDTKGLVKQRRHHNRTFTVVTDKNLFIQKMTEKGAVVKSSETEEAKETDAIITFDWLRHTFVGGSNKVNPLVNQVLQELRENDNTRDLIVTIRNGVTVVTNKNLFIQKMTEKGARLQEKDLLELQETDAPITRGWLTDTYHRRGEVIRPLADMVIKELSEDENTQGLVVRRKNGQAIVTAVTDIELFKRKMAEKEAETKEEHALKLQKIGARITQRWLADTFVQIRSDRRKVTNLANQVIRELEGDENTKDLVFKASGRKGKSFTAITDKELFIRKMIEKGAELKEQGKEEMLNVQETDAAITQPWLRATFYLDYSRSKSIADQVIGELRNDANTQGLVTKRKSGTHIITAVTDKDLFIQKMVEKGAKLKGN